MSTPLFRMVCVPAALDGVSEDFVEVMLRDGELALLADASGLDGINAVARRLDVPTVPVVRAEDDDDRQERTVIEHAGSLPLVWLATGFSDAARTWATDRGPMTLLVEVTGPLPDDEQRRVERFCAILGRQSE